MQMTLAHRQPPRQPSHALIVDAATRDQPQRPPDKVTANVPLRRSRLHIRPAPPTSPKPSGLRSRGQREEPAVTALRSPRRTAGPAVDASARHRHHKPAVKPRITAGHRAVEHLELGHNPIVHRAADLRWQRSDQGMKAASKADCPRCMAWGGVRCHATRHRAQSAALSRRPDMALAPRSPPRAGIKRLNGRPSPRLTPLTTVGPRMCSP